MQFLNIFHVLVAIALIVFVLIQKGQGATAGAAFGSGASGTVFGARGAGNFLSRTTWVLAGFFCVISLTMAIMVSRMMEAPEAGLGVVGESAPVQVEAETQPLADDAGESLFSADEAATSDVPEFDTSADSAGTAADDLPAADAANDGTPDEPDDG
ncbi:MAG: preprotein translocase subunit SecG [Xanthomonadales bacterium]|jgi:preprotein translocase subunit SecG|nr:preprotein translocase subunit SecG [Xanthomonadales bacterium]